MQSKQYRDRMGRLNPNDPHKFVAQPTATESLGGVETASLACGVCGGSKFNAVHIRTDPAKPIRENHGPFGQ